MPQTTDPSSNTLPRPELNPLLNPLLAENMSRWAEVYFNNPPERREQAVLELLRELEAQRALRETAKGVPRATFHNAPPAGDVSAAQVFTARPAQELELVRCERCGRENPITHKFCGMCGETMHPRRDSERSAAATSTNSHSNEDSREQEQGRIKAEPVAERNFESYEERRVPPAGNWKGLSLFQSEPQEQYGDYGDADAVYEPSRSHSYRIYIGSLLAIVLLALGYTAWRASQNSQASDEPSSPPPVAAKDTPTEAALSANAKGTAPAPSAPAAEKPAPPAAKVPSSTLPHENGDKVNVGGRVASAKANNDAQSRPSAGGGSEEFAEAERYLNGTNGRRDSAAAAQWLWKSVAKNNGPATLLLADLYLRGDGVAKSCDQARVLLYAAARKGVSGVGERLRNMPAFGCQ